MHRPLTKSKRPLKKVMTTASKPLRHLFTAITKTPGSLKELGVLFLGKGD